MTHVLFVTPYYPPEITPPAIRISETARQLISLGYDVTVLTTFPNFPSGIVPVEYRGRVFQEENYDGVHVIRVWTYIAPNRGFWRRILAQLSFGCVAPFLGMKAVGSPDIIIVESPPLFDAIAVRILSWFKHCPFIFTVSDLWPESAVQLGMLRNPLLIRLAERLEWSTYRRARAVWALTDGIRNTLLRRGLPSEHVFVLTNGVDVVRFRPLPKAQARAELGWDDRFTIIYAGNHGLVYALSTLLDAADMMKDNKNIHFIFVGDGIRKSDLVAEARRRELKNVTFLDAVPHDQMPLFFAGADVCIAPLRKLPLLEGTLPFKMFEVMACARPFILGAEGIARKLAVEEAEAAMCVEPENAAELVSAILYLHDHPDQSELLGLRGRAFVETHFSREQLTRALEAQIFKLIGKEVEIAIPHEASVASGSSSPSQVHSAEM